MKLEMKLGRPRENHRLIADAEDRGAWHSAEFNQLEEAGKGHTKKAQEHWRKGQYWLNRANNLRNWH
jgi:hypothetical protein